MIRGRSLLPRRMSCIAAAVALGAALLATGGLARAAADTVDEIHYSFGSAPYGTTPDSVVFDWRGTETLIEYATDTDYTTNVANSAPDPYTLQATASTPAIQPVDNTGPFQEVTLSGLTAGTEYHYRIGADGLDHTFRTTPTDDFTWVDIGDTGTTPTTGSTCTMTWMTSEQALVAAQSPWFVTHGGDISYANQCGVPAVHQYFLDQQAWSDDAAFMPVWGNHEYGPPTSTAPLGTPRDSLANYKGRVAISNPQTLSVDTSTLTSNPGCGANGINSCQGEDWGWFAAGHVLFISYPEPWTNAYTDWEPVAQNLMAQAQGDPSIDFIVTYGHRPAYSSASSEVVPALQTALTTLSNLYSPTPANPQGKYILNISHHVHAEEVFAPIGGLVNITNGGGGAGQSSLTTPAAGSIFRATHPAILSAHYDATAHTLKVDLLCGPEYPTPKYVCPNGYGSSIYSQTFYPPSTTLRATIDDGITTPTANQPVTYVMTATAAVGTAPGVTMTATLPPGYSINDAGDGTVNGSTITWALNDIPAGTTVTKSVATTFTSGSPGSSLVATVQLQDTGGAVCANANSICTATDTDTLPPTTTQWVTNPSVETSLTGWTGVWNAASVITRATTDGYLSNASVQVARNSGSGAAGFSSKPKVVTSTSSGTPYTASVEVKGKVTGQVITLLIKETNSAGTTVGSKTASVKLTNTGWNALNLVYTAVNGGDGLTFSVYCGNLPTGGWFRADAMSLTSPT